MKLPSVKDLPVAGKKVLLRTNYDIPITGDSTRIEKSLPTIRYLLGKKAKVVIISHLGRPEGRSVPKLSLEPIAEKLTELLKRKVPLELIPQKSWFGPGSSLIVMLENLRFYPGEEKNEPEFAQKLARVGDVYVNEAFACSHREHASIVGVPKFLPVGSRAFGFGFLKEVEVLSKIRENPRRPVVLILGGVKKDKINAAKKLVYWADYILVGGKLVEYNGIPDLIKHPKIKGSLIKDGQDITMETVNEFKKIIAKAKTIVWVGPMGNFYDKRYQMGTKEIAEAIVKSRAFAVIGGGDTEAALSRFGLEKKISFIAKQQTLFISSGGGAMLEFLAEGMLPGIEAIQNG